MISTKPSCRLLASLAAVGATMLGLLMACAVPSPMSGQALSPAAARTLPAFSPGAPNVISRWNEIAAATIDGPAAPAGTPEERAPNYAFDLATVHVAMYDAVVAISGGGKPLVAAPKGPTAGASQEAAAITAACEVLGRLFPARASGYRPACEAQLAALPDDAACTLGAAIGREVGAAVADWRANDGRSVALPPFVAGDAPGQFRGPAIVGRAYPSVRPFALRSAAQFRVKEPPALTSDAYARALAETRSLGGAVSSARTDELATSARFHSEPPFRFWPRNVRVFLTGTAPLLEQARLGALIWVTHADATIACFDAKYHYLAWRPFSAINLASEDADPAWKPFLPTPPHPEYPAAHACVTGALAQSLETYFGTEAISFDFDSMASQTRHHYDSTKALVDDVEMARIGGGMHFRFSAQAGESLGREVARWTAAQTFQLR